MSIDGPKETHERIRVKHCYDRIKKNIAESGVPVTLSMAVSQFNANTIEELIEEWRRVPNIKNWTFDFFTPVRGLKLDGAQWMGFEERDRIVDRLVALKRKYPDLIGTTEEALRLMKSERCKSVTDRCVFRERSTASRSKRGARTSISAGATAVDPRRAWIASTRFIVAVATRCTNSSNGL